MTAGLRCVIFDLDGVLVHTDRFHEEAWRTIAREEGIAFDPSWPARLRGVDRMQSLEIILEGGERGYSRAGKASLAERKNELYRRAIESISPRDLSPGALELFKLLRTRGIKVAIASSSRNAPALLDRLGLRPHIDATADGNDSLPAKPDPALFLLAAVRAGVPPESCVVVEDAAAGIEAARQAGMRCIHFSSRQDGPAHVPAVSTMAALRGVLSHMLDAAA
jgi:beta-phosphoglucomutase